MNDWRIMGQKVWMGGKTFISANAEKMNSDHEHCEYCWERLDKSDLKREWYSTLDGYRWVCPDCFNDFRVQEGMKLFYPGCFKDIEIVKIIESEVQYCEDTRYYPVRYIKNLVVRLPETLCKPTKDVCLVPTMVKINFAIDMKTTIEAIPINQLKKQFDFLDFERLKEYISQLNEWYSNQSIEKGCCPVELCLEFIY